MQLLIFALLLSSPLVLTYPSHSLEETTDEVSFFQDTLNLIPSEHVPASSTDSRSPCPMMNTLANHDILPHDGKRISSDRLLSALQTYLKLSPTASSLLVNTAMKLGTFDEATQTQLLDLSDLAKHNEIEHDASLSRQDQYFGNSTVFHAPTYALLDPYVKNGFVRYNGLPRFRHEREKHSRINNPDYLFGGKQQTSAYAEAAILFLEFKDGSNGARKDWLDVFFKEERLPFELGWEVREVSILEVLGTTTAFRILAA